MERKMSKKYIVAGIYEDDFGCEERARDYETQVIVVLRDESGSEESVRQSDAWLYQQDIQEGDEVVLEGKRLEKIS